MKLLGYGRISDPSKQGDGYSYDYQRQRLAGWCALYGHELVDIEVEGESGKSVSGRPVFKRALRRILKQNEADGILVIKLDRFSRDEADAHLLKRGFDKAGKVIICTDEPINTGEAHGDIIFGLLVSLAAAEYKTLVGRFKKGRAQAQAAGRDLTSVPGYGYKKRGEGRKAVIVEDPSEQHTLNIIMTAVKSGFTDAQIATMLNEERRLTRHGKQWQPQTIYKIRMRLTQKSGL